MSRSGRKKKKNFPNGFECDYPWVFGDDVNGSQDPNKNRNT